MILRPPRSTRTDTLFPYTTLFRSESRDGDKVLAGTTPGADGLVMLPFFNGERTPDLPHARASLHGMDTANLNRANLYRAAMRSEEHTSELQSLMRISYAVFCLKKKNKKTQHNLITTINRNY